jgi:hypothetical protein
MRTKDDRSFTIDIPVTTRIPIVVTVTPHTQIKSHSTGSKRKGRARGQRDAKPRHRRTKAEIDAAAAPTTENLLPEAISP